MPANCPRMTLLGLFVLVPITGFRTAAADDAWPKTAELAAPEAIQAAAADGQFVYAIASK